jgi:hypothetical protein
MVAPLFLFARSRLCFPVLRVGEFPARLGRLRVGFTSRRIVVLDCRFPLGGMPQLARALIQVHPIADREDHLPQHRCSPGVPASRGVIDRRLPDEDHLITRLCNLFENGQACFSDSYWRETGAKEGVFPLQTAMIGSLELRADTKKSGT